MQKDTSQVTLEMRSALSVDAMTMFPSPFLRCVVWGTGFVVITSLVLFLARFASRLVIKRKHGCESPPYAPQRNSILLGVDDAFRALRGSPRPTPDPFVSTGQRGDANTYQLELFPGRKKILTREPTLLKSVLAVDAGSWGLEPLRLFPFYPFIGAGIMNTDGAKWKKSREMLMPTFSRDQIADFSRLSMHVGRLLHLVPGDGTTVDMHPLLARLGLDSATDFLFGDSVQSLLQKENMDLDVDSFLSATKYCLRVVGGRMRLPHLNVFTRDSQFWTKCRIVQEFVEMHIDRATKADPDSRGNSKHPGRYILLDELLKDSWDHKTIRDQLLNVFMPARDASALALTNIFFLLARNPGTWEKLREEVTSTDVATGKYEKHADDTFSGLKSLKYLQQVIQEALRLHPPIGMVTRIALKDTVLPAGGGTHGSAPIFVKKGDQISINYYALHRRKDLFGDDADNFRPERWQAVKPPHWAFMPFSGGPRHCPGQQLAMAEISFTLVRFLRTFRSIENRDPVMKFVPSHKITTESQNGALVAFRR